MTNIQIMKQIGETKKIKFKNSTVYYHATIDDPKRQRDDTLEELLEREYHEETKQIFVYDWWLVPLHSNTDLKYSEEDHSIVVLNWF